MIELPYYDYGRRFLLNMIKGGYVGTVTQEFGNTAFRHGWKIVEVFELCD